MLRPSTMLLFKESQTWKYHVADELHLRAKGI
jgi:hypothetical protein